MAKSERMTVEEAVEYILSQGWELIKQHDDTKHFEAKCPKGHQLKMSCNKFKPETEFSCPVCTSGKMAGEDELSKFVNATGCKYIEYKNSKIAYECECGKGIGNTRFNDFCRGIRCGKCASEKISQKRRFSEEQAKELCKNLACKFVKISYKERSDNSYKAIIHFICPKCKVNEHYKELSNFKKNPVCPSCGRNKK